MAAFRKLRHRPDMADCTRLALDQKAAVEATLSAGAAGRLALIERSATWRRECFESLHSYHFDEAISLPSRSTPVVKRYYFFQNRKSWFTKRCHQRHKSGPCESKRSMS